jgi:glycine cleavage system H protein
MKIPENLSYSSEHLWVKADSDGMMLAGITDYAQDLLGDIVFVDAPKVGSKLKATENCGLIESVKTGSDLHAPLNGTVVAVNDRLQDHPEQINDDPYASWIFKFETENADMSGLLDATAYRRLIGDQ